MSKFSVTIDERSFEVEVDPLPEDNRRYSVKVNGADLNVILPEEGTLADEIEWVIVGDRPYNIGFDRSLHWIEDSCGKHEVLVRDLEAILPKAVSGSGRLKAPIPGQINRVLVAAGQQVENGQPVVILEAMKMQNEIRSLRTGVVTAVHVRAGETVARGELLVEIQ